MNNSPTTNGLSSSPTNNLNDLYSTFENDSLSRSSSVDSSCLEAQTSSTSSKESSVKTPYPVLSDHRDPSSVLSLLQKETQTTAKKIFDVSKQIEDCEKRLTSNSLSEKTRTSFKYQRMQRKQQLDALKKHERRVNLQIDYITTKSEIKSLEDEQQQMSNEKNSDEYKQMEMLGKKLRQKLDQMKIYMKTRNDQMKKLAASKDNRKRPSSSSSSIASTSHSNKHFKPAVNHNHHHHHKPPVVRLASRLTSHSSQSHQPIQTPTVRFLNKTTDSTINSSSPTTPASSSSTLSPPLIASTSTEDANNVSNSLPLNKNPRILEEGEIDVDFDIDELFDEDSYSETRQTKTKHPISKSEY